MKKFNSNFRYRIIKNGLQKKISGDINAEILAVSGELAYKEINCLGDDLRRRFDNMKILLIAILVLCQASAYTQTKRFQWTTELCEYEGTYDAKKYTDAQLRNTLKLFAVGSFEIETGATVWKYEEIKNLSVAALDKEYESKSAALKKLDIVKSAYWQSLRERKLKELKQVYELSRLTMLAYNEPAKLKEAAFAEACVARFANPLINGGDELLATWETVNEDSRRNNGDPERVKKIFEAERDSPDRLKFARVEVMSFGFWNCANALIEREEYDGTHEEEFKKLFKRTKTIGCDEP